MTGKADHPASAYENAWRPNHTNVTGGSTGGQPDPDPQPQDAPAEDPAPKRKSSA